MQFELNASKRTLQGSGASRRLRRADKVPGIIYGGAAEAVMVELPHNDLLLALRKEAFHSSIISLKLDGSVQTVVLRDTQMHPYKPLVLHVDFQRVDATHAIHQKVPLHFVNADKSPAGKTAGVVIMHELTEVTVACLPKDLPEAIEVDLADLAVGTVVHLSALKLPAGVEVPELKLGPDHDVAVVVAKHARGEEEAPAAEGGEEKK